MVKTTRDVVRPALLEVDRMLVQLRARGEADLADDLTMLRDLAVRSASWHIEQRDRAENSQHIRRLVELMRGEAANG